MRRLNGKTKIDDGEGVIWLMTTWQYVECKKWFHSSVEIPTIPLSPGAAKTLARRFDDDNDATPLCYYLVVHSWESCKTKNLPMIKHHYRKQAGVSEFCYLSHNRSYSGANIRLSLLLKLE
jgi:hypothetical protein